VKEAEDAIRTNVAEPLGIDILKAAQGITRIADTNMAQAVQVMTVERGYDPRDFVLVAYGGAGPSHAVSVAKELGIRKVIVPRLPGQFSAFGMLLADLKREYVLSHVKRLREIDPGVLETMYRNLEQEGGAEFSQEGFAENNLIVKRGAEMRYSGQEFTLVVSPVRSPITPAALMELKDRFDQVYRVRYGHAFPETEAELVSLRVELYGVLPKPNIEKMSLSEYRERDVAVAEREVSFFDTGFARAKVYRRGSLTLGTRISGPAIIEEPASTTVVYPGDAVTSDSAGNMIIHVNI
jgi:N-methylhydantoinase A